MEKLNHMDLLAEVYTCDELNICMNLINPADIRDEVKHHVFEILTALPSTFIIDLYQRAKLKRYVVKCLLNAVRMERSNWNRSKPKENYNFEANFDEIPEILEQEEKDVNLDLSWLGWYEVKMIELYVEHGNIRKLESLTGIPRSSIHGTILGVRKKIKFKMNAEEFLDDKHYYCYRVQNGVDVHLSASEGEMFVKLAKMISPHQEFTWKGCQECANHLVKFVYTNRKRIAYGSN